MKRIIIGIIWLLFLGNVFAQSIPQPIGGTIRSIYGNVGNLRVVLTNERTGESMEGYSNSAGQWIVDWANSVYGRVDGDVIDIKIWFCKEDAKCQGSVIIDGTPLYIEFDLDDLLNPCSSPSCPTCPTVTTAPVTTTVSCPGCPTVTTVPCDKCDTCDEGIVNLGQLIFYLVVVFGLGFGAQPAYKFVIRKNKEGKTEIQVTQHKHVGRYENYHSIYTKHNDDNYRHPTNKGEVFDLADRLNIEVTDYKQWIYDPEYNMNGGDFPV